MHISNTFSWHHGITFFIDILLTITKVTNWIQPLQKHEFDANPSSRFREI